MPPPPEYTNEEKTLEVYTNLLLITFRHLLNCTNLIWYIPREHCTDHLITISRNIHCTDHLITISRNIHCTDHLIAISRNIQVFFCI